MIRLEFMQEALKEAQKASERGDFGVGAVLVLDGTIIARASNAMISQGVWAHPETLVLRQIEKSKFDNLSRYRKMSLYTTLAPCPQCWGACLIRGIGSIIIGAHDTLSEPSYDLVPKVFSNNVPKLNWCEGEIAEKCLKVFQKNRIELDKKIGFSS